MNSGWSVTVEFPGEPTRSGVPIVREPCVEVLSTEVSRTGGTTVSMFVEASEEHDARGRGLLVAGKVARNLGLPDTPQQVTVQLQRTFL